MSISRSGDTVEETAQYSELNEWQGDLELEHMQHQFRIDTADGDVSSGSSYAHGVGFDPIKGQLDDHQVAELVWARRLFLDAYAGTSEDQAYTQGRIDTNARMAIEDNIIIDETGTDTIEEPEIADTAFDADRFYAARYNSIDRVQGRVHSAREDTSAGAGHSGRFIVKGVGPSINYRQMGDSKYGPIFETDDQITMFGNIKVESAGGAPIFWKYAIQVAWDVWESPEREFEDMRKVV